MAEFISLPVTVDPDELRDERFTPTMEAAYPGFEMKPGQLADWYSRACAFLASYAAELISDVSTDVYRDSGTRLDGIPPIDAAAATGTVTFTLTDTAGHTIPAGTTIGGQSGTTLVAFATVDDTVVAPGDDTAAAVPVVAAIAGTGGNGFTGSAVLIDSLAYVDTVVFDAATDSGEDAETLADYLNRLTTARQNRTVSPILGRNLVDLAVQYNPGVARAVALDNYNPADGTSDNPLMGTLVSVDDAGAPLSSPDKTALAAQFGPDGETPVLVDVTVNLADAHYSDIDVVFTAVAESGYDPADVNTRAEQAVLDYLSPASFPMDEPKVRVIEVGSVLNAVAGLRYVATLTIEGSAADYTLPTTNAEPVGLPSTASTASGTTT